MNIIVCLEDKNGMMFNKRRLSQDVAIREDIYKNMDGKSLIMNAYSYKMFSKDEPKIDIIAVSYTHLTKISTNGITTDSASIIIIDSVDFSSPYFGVRCRIK